MSQQYQRYLKLLEKWPVDKTKRGRDLGESLRFRVKLLLDPLSIAVKNTEHANKEIESLERLANNVHGNNYKRLFNSTATGLTADQCSQVLSSEFLHYLNN